MTEQKKEYINGLFYDLNHLLLIKSIILYQLLWATLPASESLTQVGSLIWGEYCSFSINNDQGQAEAGVVPSSS